MIRVPALIQRLPENIPAQLHPPANQYPGQFPELHIRQSVLAELEAAPVANGDDSGRSGLRFRFEQINQTLETVFLGLALQTLPLPEAIGEDKGAVAQEVQDIAEKDTVAVQEDSGNNSKCCVTTEEVYCYKTNTEFQCA